MVVLTWLNSLKLWIRWPLKSLVFLTTMFLVLFPRVDRFAINVIRYRDLNSLINPESAALAPLASKFDLLRQPEWNKQQEMKELERFVYRHIPYEWDWNLWSNVDYIPTVEEVIALGKEDCDGRAVVAASMLRRYGYKARLVSDLTHVWVATDSGETMSPGKKKAIEFTEEGMKFDWSFVWDLPKTGGLGIAVFPLWRELIIVAVIWLLMIGKDVGIRKSLIWLSILMIGLMLIREGARPKFVDPDKMWIGYAVWALAIIAIVLQTRWTRK